MAVSPLIKLVNVNKINSCTTWLGLTALKTYPHFKRLLIVFFINFFTMTFQVYSAEVESCHPVFKSDQLSDLGREIVDQSKDKISTTKDELKKLTDQIKEYDALLNSLKLKADIRTEVTKLTSNIASDWWYFDLLNSNYIELLPNILKCLIIGFESSDLRGSVAEPSSRLSQMRLLLDKFTPIVGLYLNSKGTALRKMRNGPILYFKLLPDERYNIGQIEMISALSDLPSDFWTLVEQFEESITNEIVKRQKLEIETFSQLRLAIESNESDKAENVNQLANQYSKQLYSAVANAKTRFPLKKTWISWPWSNSEGSETKLTSFRVALNVNGYIIGLQKEKRDLDSYSDGKVTTIFSNEDLGIQVGQSMFIKYKESLMPELKPEFVKILHIEYRANRNSMKGPEISLLAITDDGQVKSLNIGKSQDSVRLVEFIDKRPFALNAGQFVRGKDEKISLRMHFVDENKKWVVTQKISGVIISQNPDTLFIQTSDNQNESIEIPKLNSKEVWIEILDN